MNRLEIHGKSVYVFEGHNVAFEAWAEVKGKHSEDLNLITLDHHTDTLLGFGRSTHRPKLEEHLPVIAERVAQIDLKNEAHVKQAVVDLWNDEQIDAAVQVGIFRYAFCFNNHHTNTRSVEESAFLADNFHSAFGRRPEPPFTYAIPERRIYEIGEICAVGCEETCHGDECTRLHADQVIESIMLDRLVATANTIAAPTGIQSIVTSPYVLDIDLDYFRSIKSLSPEDATTFHRLIADCVAMTIATEPNYVKELRIDDSLTSELALHGVLKHVENALS